MYISKARSIIFFLCLLLLSFSCLSACSNAGTEETVGPGLPDPAMQPAESPLPVPAALPSKSEIIAQFGERTPIEWGDNLDGIISSFAANDAIALTFDACGWGKGSGYDENLIRFLMEEEIPSTLFLSGKWIEDNPGRLEEFSACEFFEIENHGYSHKPLSVNGHSQYGIRGTTSVAEVYDEIQTNAEKIFAATGRMPIFFRTGTAAYDEIALEIVQTLGEQVAGYTLAADAGATFSAAQIIAQCQNAAPGSILLFHMNHPESGTADGVFAVVHILKEKGFRFILLEDAFPLAT